MNYDVALKSVEIEKATFQILVFLMYRITGITIQVGAKYIRQKFLTEVSSSKNRIMV